MLMKPLIKWPGGKSSELKWIKNHIPNNFNQRWLATLLLALFLGTFGVHRFYAGRTGTGILMLITLGGFGIWYLIDLILVITGNLRDGDGNLITQNILRRLLC